MQYSSLQALHSQHSEDIGCQLGDSNKSTQIKRLCYVCVFIPFANILGLYLVPGKEYKVYKVVFQLKLMSVLNKTGLEE